MGVGCLAALLVLVATTAIFNWDRLKEFYRSNVRAMSELQGVRAAIQAAYDTSNVTVVSKSLIAKSNNTELPHRILSIELVNPPFLGDIPEERLADKAREIASLARESYPSSGNVDSYEIVLSNRTGGLVSVGSRRHFIVRAEEVSREPSAPQ
jgi:hypothetical protein